MSGLYRACARCGTAYRPRHARDRHCPACTPRGRASRSPSTQAQDAEYREERDRILAGNPPCHWCGRPATTADHLIPVAQGGGHKGNLVPACHACNSSRQDNPDWTPPERDGPRIRVHRTRPAARMPPARLPAR